MKILSFDIGGTKIAYALVDECGQLLEEPTRVATPDSVEEIKDVFKKVIQQVEADGFSFASAGVVYNNKLVKQPINLPKGYENINFSELANVPVLVENDANAAAWCEYKIGNAKDCEHAIILAIGTGVGCGIICDGKLLKGKSGAAGEHVFKISGKDLALMAKENDLPSDCFTISELVKKGHKTARKVYDDWQNRVLETVIQLNDLFDTQKIIIAGSLAEIIDYKYLQNNIKKASFGEPPIIMKSAGFKYPALSGAALLWYDAYKK